MPRSICFMDLNWLFGLFLQSKTHGETMLWLVSRSSRELYSQLSLAEAIAFTAPVQTADVERLFSVLKLVRKKDAFIEHIWDNMT